jgi:hypothetical protein
MKNNKMLVLLVSIGLLVSHSALSNKYDDEEKLRRFLEDSEKSEQRERDAAKRRYDDKHNSGGGGGAGVGVLGFLIIVAGAGYLVFKKNDD